MQLTPAQQQYVMRKMMQESRRLGRLGTPLREIVEVLREKKPAWIREALRTEVQA